MAAQTRLTGDVPPVDRPRKHRLLIFLIVVCVVFGLLLFAIFSGLFSGDDYEGFGANRPPRLRELPPGCLLTLIVAGCIWFVAWGIVLLLAIRLLRTPLGE